MTNAAFSRFALLTSIVISPLGCSIEVEEENVDTVEQMVRPKACPAIAILCIEGYQVKQLPNCNQICVPDQGNECDTDADCGAIACFTDPCPQPVCLGHHCTTGDATPGGQACGDTHCGAGMYCCNASCGICAPDGGACIQIACVSE